MKKFSDYLKKPVTWLFLIIYGFFGWVLWYVYGFNDNKSLSKNDSQGSKYDVSFNAVATKDDFDRQPIGFNRNINIIDYSNIMFTPWDIKAASVNMGKRKTKDYSIMIYMNGSDLESENGSATKDLVEMLESGVNPDNVNIIIFTGGTNRWQNDIIPENNCVIWEISDGRIYKINDVGLVNMGDPGTLSSFISFSMENFPAKKYGLILWDHGGGSIAGYGHDEKFNNSNLTLLDMNYAFEKSMPEGGKLEFLGFDSCLMASIEMAVVASDYARYLVASEDLTPGDGWDYGFLAALNNNPSMDGLEIGKEITDYFMDYYGTNADFDLNMSVVGLSDASRVMSSMGNLMRLCSESLLSDRSSSFRTLAAKRNNTKTFGMGSPRDNECDMVDIGDMANKLYDLFPNECARLLADLEKTVLYNRNNSGITLCGLNTYYIYGGKNTGKESLDIYTSLIMDEDYTQYLRRFFNILTGGIVGNSAITRSSNQNDDSHSFLNNEDNIIGSSLTAWQSVDGKPGHFILTGIKNDVDMASGQEIISGIDALWPEIQRENVCMYKISDSGGRLLYSIPVALNGRDSDIIVLFSEKYPDGKILGARNQDGFIIQKGYDRIKDGDKISFYRQERYFENNNENRDKEVVWHKSKEITVYGELKLDWSRLDDDNIYYSMCLTDIQYNEYFTPLSQYGLNTRIGLT